MNLLEVFDKFALPTALIVVLLGTIGIIGRVGWLYFTKKEAELLARLDAERLRAEQSQKEFLAAITNQNNVAATIAATMTTLLAPIKEGTDENLKSLNTLIDTIRDGNEKKPRRTKK